MTSEILDPHTKVKWIDFLHELDLDIDPKSISLMGQMHGVAHALYQAGESNLASAGLSYARFRLLLNLLIVEKMEGRSGLNPSEISTKQGISRNTVSALIRDLEQDGLIERQLDQEDRRRFNIRLTSSGRDLVRQHAGSHFRFVGHCFGDLTLEKQAALGEILENLESNIKRSTSCK